MYFLENGVTILNVEQLLHEAIEAFNNNEMLDGEVSLFISIINNISNCRLMILIWNIQQKLIMIMFLSLMEIQRLIKQVITIFNLIFFY